MVNKIWNVDGKDTAVADGAVVEWDDHKYFTITHNGNSFYGEILEDCTESNFIRVKINHREFKISKKGELDDLIVALGMDKPKVRQLKELQAPMPGRIVNIAVSVGQHIEIGEEILSLEAMKMENVLKAEGIGTVKTILCKSEDVVDKGTVLIEFE